MRKRIHISHPSDESSDALINLTPLIDIVFVMLIMFIVVAPMLEMDQVDLADGGSDSKELSATQNSSPVVIHVRKDNTILVNQVAVALAQLPKRLHEIKKTFPQATPLIFHDKRAYFGTYQQVKNALESAGFKEMHLVLNPS